MKLSKEGIKKILLYVFMGCLVCLGLLLSIQSRIDKNKPKEKIEIDQIETDLKTVTSSHLYYTVCDCIDKYLLALYQKEDVVYDYLDTKFAEQKSIQKSNVIEKLEDISVNSTIDVKKMKYQVKEDFYRCFVKGNVIDSTGKIIKEDVLYIVHLDMINKAFSICPIKEGEGIEQATEEVKANENNLYNYKTVSVQELIRKYLAKYKLYLENDLGQSYYMLDEEYRNKRFKNIEEYEQYILQNRDLIYNITTFDYAIDINGEYTEYIIRDAKGLYYIIDEYGINDFKIKLDTYTVQDADWIAEYENGNNGTKCAMNIEQFIEMLNKRDYNKAYSCLSEGFKENYFKNVSAFEDYMKNNFPKLTRIQYLSSSVTGDLYKFNVNIISGEDGTIKNRNFIVKLTDEDFSLSFGIY